MNKDKLRFCSKIILVIIFVYLFLVSIELMSTALKGFGGGFAENLIKTTSNPFIGLSIGILATSIWQSSSITTSIVVGMVASGVITISNAIPIILGANIGTTVTGALVALGHISRREEFRRAITGGTLAGFFKIMCVCILFPLELTIGILSRLAQGMSNIFANVGGIKFISPIKLATGPTIHLIKNMFMRLKISNNVVYVLLLICSLMLLFAALYFIVKITGSLVVKRAEIVLNNIIGRHGILAILVALIFTSIIQSSSITVALMIPLVAAGILTAKAMYPIIIGANIGTTVTAILASFATGNNVAITAAFFHFIFNIICASCIYPIKVLREIPMFLAVNLGNLALRKRRYAVLYILVVFFIIPGIFIIISRLLK